MRRATALSSILFAATTFTAAATTIGLNRAEFANVRNLQEIALAMHNYRDANGSFPGQYIAGGGPPTLSWRVSLLPYLNEQALYNQFDLTKPWDDPANVRLLQQMPAVFRSPIDEPDATTTRYLVGSGPNTIFEGATGIRFGDIIDGTSNTILVGEAAAGVPWTKPEDIPIGLNPVLGGAGFASFTRGAVPFAFADGAVRFVPDGIDSQTLRSLFLRNDLRGDYRIALDFELVPEPGTMSLAGIGGAAVVACIAATRKRRGATWTGC